MNNNYEIIKIKGGLGNQMFQYAFARYFGIQKSIEVKIDNGVNTNKKDTCRQYGLKHFNITLPLASTKEVLRAKYPYGIISKLKRGFKAKILKIYNIEYTEKILKTKEKYLEGFWQSYKYLESIRNILLREFSLKAPLKEKFVDILRKIENTPSASIHIRRGDYVTNSKVNSYHGACDLEYYSTAIDIVQAQVNNPTFFIFSDDIDWVSKNLEIKAPTVWVSNLEGEDFEEMFLMSKCKHNIIANSTFSWWGAWLNENPNKIVIAPKQWLKNKTADELGILPKEWLQI